MRRSRLQLVIVAVLSGSALHGRPSEPVRQAGAEGFVITHVRVFDGERSRSNLNVWIAGDIIRAVGDDASAFRAERTIDGTGATLLPGLIDAHTHTQDVSQLQQAIRFGVTTVLDMFTAPAVEPALRGAAAARADVADFRSSGVLATAPGGHGTEYGVAIPTVAGPADAVAFVRARQAAGADYLKIVLNGVRDARDGTPTLDQATTEALVRAAHSLGLLVVAHVETPNDARIAVMSGADGLAHIWRQGGAAPEVAELVARRNVFVIPTLVTPDGLVKGSGAILAGDARLQPFLTGPIRTRLTGSLQAPAMESIEPMLGVVRGLRAAGARLLAGSDVPNFITVHGVSLHRELELLVKGGLSPEEALAAATSRVADAFRLQDRGRIAPGRRADLVLVRGDPTRDITATRDILRVWRSGVEFDRRLR
jgi:imidazolonepropionase-like amidohydrolase